MPGKSQSHTDAVLNVLRGTDLTGVAPYVGLFSVAPADDNSAGTELSGNGYARQAITFGAPATDAGNVRKVANTNNIQFGPALANWPEAVAFGGAARLRVYARHGSRVLLPRRLGLLGEGTAELVAG